MVENVRDAPDPELVEYRGHDVFVSYSRADRDAVVSLTAGLASRGKRAWVDLEDIPPSTEWMDEIRAAIDAADAYLVVVSPDVARSSVCAEELEHARSGGKRIVPVVVRSTDPGTVPKSLASLNWIDATEPGRLEPALEAVVTALDTDPEHVKAHTHLLVRATDWQRGGEDRSLLLRGKELTEAERTIAELDRVPRPTQLQTRFVLASRKAGSRRQRGAIAIVTAMLLVAASMGVVALAQRNAAKKNERLALERAAESRSRELAAAASLHLQGDAELSILLAIEAEKAAPTRQAEDALRAALASSRVRLVLRGHKSPVFDVELTDGGNVAVSGGADGTIRIWDLRSASLIRTIDTGGGGVLDVQVTSDGQNIMSIDDENHIDLWDRNSGERLGSWSAAGAALSPSGDMLVTVADTARATAYSVPGGDVVSSSQWHGPLSGGTRRYTFHAVPDSIVRFDDAGDRVLTTARNATWVWDPQTGRIISGRNEEGTVNSATISPDGHLVVTSDSLSTGTYDAVIWSADSGAVVLPLRDQGGFTSVAAFDPVGRLLAVAGGDGPVHLWDIQSRREIAVMHNSSPITSVGFSSDGKTLVTSSNDQTARIWDVPSGLPVAALVGHTDGVESAAITPEGDRVVTASRDGTLRVWEVEPDVVRFPDQPGIPGVAIWDENYQSLSPDGKVVATADTNGTISVWEVATGKLGATIRPHDGAVALVAFSPQGDRLVTSGANGSSALWSWPDLQVVRRFRSGVLQFVRFSDDGRFLAVTAGTGFDTSKEFPEDGVELRNTETGTLLGERTFNLPRAPTYGADFSNDGTEIAFGRGKAVGAMQVIDRNISEGLELGEHKQPVTTLDFASDGRRLLTASFDGTVSLWDVKSHELIRTFTTGSGAPVITAFFAPGDERFVAGADDNAATVWDVRTGKAVLSLTDHVGGVGWASYSPDGRLIETEADAVRIWDAMTGALLATIPITAPAANVQFTPDSTSVVITDDAGRTIVYHCELCVSTQQLLTLAESRVTRELTPEERATYLGE